MRGCTNDVHPDIEMERCILRTDTLDNYKYILQRSTSARSDVPPLLQSLIRSHGKVWLGQTIEPSAECSAALIVVDCIPATAGILTESTTVIVFPPSSDETEPSTCTGEEQLPLMDNNGADEAGEGVADGVCVVQLDHALTGSAAVASESFLLHSLIPDGSVVCVGDEEYTTVFALTGTNDIRRLTMEEQQAGVVCGPQSRSAAVPTLYASPTVFRNIRACVTLDMAPAVVTSRLQYSDSQLYLPVSMFRAARDTAGLFVTLESMDGGSAGELCLSSLIVKPAWPPFVLKEVFGEKYGDILSVALKASRDVLHGQFVAEGDVVLLSFTLKDLVEQQLDHNTVTEVALARAAHIVECGCVLSQVSASQHGGAITVPLRVAEVSAASNKTYGRIVLSEGSVSTELTLSLQEISSFPDVTPLLSPPRTAQTFLAKLSLTRSIRNAISQFHVYARAGEARVFVIHATRDNLPIECISTAVSSFGFDPLIIDLERKSDGMVQELFDAYMHCAGGLVLVMRNAQQLQDRTELLQLFDEESIDEKCGVSDTDDGGKGSSLGIRAVFLLCECVEVPPPVVAAQARNVEGVIRGTNPSDDERRLIIESIFEEARSLRGFGKSLLLSYESVAAWTVGLTAADVVAYAQECVSVLASMSLADGVFPVLSDTLCSCVLEKFQKAHGHSLVSTKLQPVRWSDVGGLEDAKRELREMIQLPLLYPELLSGGGATRQGAGILFYGPPGCGKTLLAKAVATEMNMNFMAVKGPELINQYVGESEKNIRLLFQRARDSSPCIIFFDELDALAPARGAKGDAGGAMDRIVSQLLVEVDGVGHSRSDGSDAGKVFIIGATNRPDLLDPSLLRPGRFDKLCYLGIPSTRSEQLVALKALTRKFDLAEDVDLEALLQPMSLEYTGADLFALCSDAMMFAVEAMLQESLPQDGNTSVREGAPEVSATSGAERRFVVTMDDFVRARNQLRPSVTTEDLRRYENLRSKFGVK
uniref:Peroxisomal ATPase PEX6 n=1 Tax=Trypanosoma congolense (strain IL3000) TaxID=1068625 RepID=G0UM34_TRYCI|nr:putative peroxisome assembly protein [Trypanosoma congolense IL3000]